MTRAAVPTPASHLDSRDVRVVKVDENAFNVVLL